MLDLALGRLPSSARDAILSSKIIAPDQEEMDKVRPLALGAFVRRSCSRAVARLFTRRVATSLSATEYSLGIGRGDELMHRAVLLDLDMRGNAVKISLDISNAYNEFDRRAAWDSTIRSVPEMGPWVHSVLSSRPTHVHVGTDGHRTKLIKSRRGDQGDPLTALTFRVALDAQAAARTLDG